MHLYLRYLLATFVITWVVFFYILVRSRNSILDDSEEINFNVVRHSYKTNDGSKTCLSPDQEGKLGSQIDHLKNLNNLKLLARQKTNDILLSKDSRDKNGIALSFLELILDFVSVDGGFIQAAVDLSNKKSRKLTEGARIVNDKILALQFPNDCKKVPKINCNVFKNCGIGCQLHHLIYCLAVSYALNRTLVVEYNQAEADILVNWSDYLLPFSNCTTHDYQSQPFPWSEESIKAAPVVDLPMVEVLDPRPRFLPAAVPESIYNLIKCCHTKPDVWFIGQLASFIVRPNSRVLKQLQIAQTNFNLIGRSYFGCHIRRTDKVGVEAKFHHVFEYHTALLDAHKLFLNTNSSPHNSKLVFLATDDSNAVREFRSDFKFFEIMADLNSIESAGVMQRKAKASITRALIDIILLSKADFIVCTFSSQFCRLAYELSQSYDSVDKSWRFDSLDDLYYFGGQNDNFWKAISNHTSHGVNELTLKEGDQIKISGDLKTGYFTGINQRTQKEGMFPAYKVQQEFSIYRDYI